MKRRVILAAAAASSLLGGAAVSAAPPGSAPTRDFIQAAAESDRFEILEGRLAMAEGRDPRVRGFAQEMIQAHSEMADSLRRATASSGLATPLLGLSGDQAMLLNGLQAQRGPEFDKTYLRHQVLGHQQAVVVDQGYAQIGSDAAVRREARSAEPMIRRHLQEAQRLCSALHCAD